MAIKLRCVVTKYLIHILLVVILHETHTYKKCSIKQMLNLISLKEQKLFSREAPSYIMIGYSQDMSIYFIMKINIKSIHIH